MAGWLSVAPYDWLIAQTAKGAAEKARDKVFSNHLHLYGLVVQMS